uniref:Uncharacterized protein n=1 Tax=Klebsiella pneumoniae TaxID=573 RepID=A0A8B0STV4_KLEPN|nr:hypothetical protein [Klebsiella pneumoniae]
MVRKSTGISASLPDGHLVTFFSNRTKCYKLSDIVKLLH